MSLVRSRFGIQHTSIHTVTLHSHLAKTFSLTLCPVFPQDNLHFEGVEQWCSF